MVFVNYIVENFVMIMELIGLLVLLGISAHGSERMKRLTLAVVALLLLESVCFHLERWTQTFERVSLLRPMLTAAIYSLYPVILVLVMQITVRKKLRGRTLLLLLIPEIVCVPIYFTSQWTHLVCWFHEDNHYAGGPLAWLPYMVFGFYSLVFLIHNLRYFRSYSGKSRFTAVYIVLAPLLGVVYYLIFGVDRDYCALFTAALLLYYIFVYIHLAVIDPLTSLLNRQSYYQDLELGAKSISGVVSVDMNELKYLNDSFGHEAGDAALKTISSILLEHCGRGGVPYRVGGDEFMLLYTGVQQREIEAFVQTLRGKLSETPYTCAFGLAMVKPGGTVHEALVEADANMYADKAALKAEMQTKGTPLHMRD
jgi:diguanylate cyclase (GGDEF)-like protein